MASEIYQGNEQNKRFYNAFALSGRRAKCDDTQGDALGYELLPFQGVWGNRTLLITVVLKKLDSRHKPKFHL